MRHMLKRAALATAAAVTFGAGTANAEVIVCTEPNCAPTDENILVTAATNATTITGTTNNTGVNVFYTSATDTLDGDASGQARVSAYDGLLNDLLVTIQSGYTFSSAVFNLSPLPGNQANEALEVFIRYLVGGVEYTQTFAISDNGSNWFGIYGTAGEVFTAIGFTASPITDGISDMRQLRLGGVQQAIPEPGTWLMMLLGFGAVGFALRRRREQNKGLLQIA